MNKIKMFDLTKIKIQQLIKSNYNLILTEDEQLEYTIRQQDTPLFRQLAIMRGYETDKINELLFVEAKHNKKRTEQLKKILREGFTYNNKHYVRFGKSSSQAKDGITVFVDESFYNGLMERSQLGVQIDKCVISKYESYRCLIFSSCQIVEEKLPYIVIVDEYKKIIPNQHVRYAIQKDVEYVNNRTKEKKIAKNQKFIEENYKDIDVSPFDGFGVHTHEISEKFSQYTPNEHDSVLFQIRLPFMKGVSVEVDFKRFYKEQGITQIEDVFGKWHNVEDIDCLWNTSMWKGFSIFKDAFGNEAWNEYINRINKYQYKIGISKYNHHTDDLNFYSRLNFQYIQCLDLYNPKYIEHFKHNIPPFFDMMDENNWGKMINVAKYSTDLMEKIIKGDKLYTLKFLGINNTNVDSVNSKYIESILINDSMLKDPSIKKMLKRKLDKTINQMKFGKIFAKGFYHTVVGDIKGYLEYAAGLDIIGCLNAGEFHVKTLPEGDCLSFRSPLVDPSEVNKVNLVNNEWTDTYLPHFENADIVMINMYDLTQQQQGGMDEDGDAVFLSDEEILVDSKIDKPIVVDVEDKKSSGKVKYDLENIVKYECNSRDNRIGEITNIATSILNQYTENEKWKKINADNVSLLRLYQGKEIDYLKTGFRWIISRNLRKYLEKLPYFLLYNYPKKLNVYNRIRNINKGNKREDRIPYNAYRSPSPMNELCEYVNQWERHKIDWDRSLINNGHLLVDQELELSDKQIIKKIKRIYDEFDIDLRDAIENDIDISILANTYLKKLNKLNLDEYLLTNYCIKVAYRSVSSDKTLCWILFGDEMLKNLRNNSDERKELVIIETEKQDNDSHDFLGKYYKLIKKQLGA
jgi:hypothetical protein